MARTWRKEDITYLKRYAQKRTMDALTKRFRTDADQVKDKLEELTLQTKDGYGYREPWVDPALADFEKGLAAFHSGKIAAARKHFRVVLSGTEQTDLLSRAQLYLKACDERDSANEGKNVQDPYLDAVVAKNRGDFDAALALCNAGGRRSKDERFAYLAAAVQAAAGEEETAMELLRQAIEMNPENRVRAYHDSDFDSLRAGDAFEALFEDVRAKQEAASDVVSYSVE